MEIKFKKPYPVTVSLKNYMTRGLTKQIREVMLKHKDIDFQKVHEKAEKGKATDDEITAVLVLAEVLAKGLIESAKKEDGTTIEDLDWLLDEISQEDFIALQDATMKIMSENSAEKKTESLSTQ